MRCQTAARAKAGGRKICGAPLQECPREGSQLRWIYDLLQENKGRPVEIESTKKAPIGPQLVQLENIYGLDVRHVRNGSSRTGRKSTYLLAGEWFGRVYVDYVAERIESGPSQ